MMAKASEGDLNYDPTDPEARLRQRLTAQFATDPSAPTTDSAAQSDSPMPSAPFDAVAPTDSYTPPDPVPTITPPAQPTAPAAPPAFSGGGGPPLPQDPYYAAYGQEHPGANTAAPVGTQLNYDNTPLASAGGARDANYLRQVVQSWPNPYGHQDPDYWVNKLLTADNGGPTDANIAYFKGRYLEDPNNNPHSPQNQPGAGAMTNVAPYGSSGAIGYNNPNLSVAQNFVAGLQAPGGLWGSDFTNQIRQILMQRLQQAGQPVDPNNPNITQAMTAARDEASRSTDQERTALAERLYAQGGLNTEALTQQVQQSGERNATALGSLRANLISREITQRQSELKDLMQMALASGDAESARAIQMQLAALNAMMQEEGMGVNLAEFGAQLNQNAALAGLRG